MPKSKHRRKGKTRPRAAPLPGLSFQDIPLSELLDGGPGDSDDDPDMAEAQAQDELAAELAAADFGDDGDENDFDDEDIESATAPLLQAVEEQVRTNEPPEVAATLARLLSAGHARDEAIRLIGAVLMMELN